MSWKGDVRSRFSPDEDSVKWDRMYAQETENIEDEFFRLRRDFTIDYVASHYDTSAEICDLGCGAGPVISELLKRGYNNEATTIFINIAKMTYFRYGLI